MQPSWPGGCLGQLALGLLCPCQLQPRSQKASWCWTLLQPALPKAARRPACR